jgi:hypothetical protein
MPDQETLKVGYRRACEGKITISNVAIGPSKIDSKNQMSPLRPLPCASPALIKVSVLQPTTYPCHHMGAA